MQSEPVYLAKIYTQYGCHDVKMKYKTDVNIAGDMVRAESYDDQTIFIHKSILRTIIIKPIEEAS